MKNKELRSSLIKSAVLLLLCVFFIYSFAVSESGGVVGTLQSLFSGALFLVGLALALTVSVAVLIGIYFGILYLYNEQVCKKTYKEFKTTLSDSSESLASSLGSPCCSAVSNKQAQISEEEITALHDNQNRLNSQLQSIEENVQTLSQTIDTLSTSVTSVAEEIHKLDSKITTVEEKLSDTPSTASIAESIGKLNGEISSLQASVQPLAPKLSELENALSSQGDGEEEKDDELKEIVDTAIADVKEELAAVKRTMDSLAAVSMEGAAEPEGEEPHRILSYFSNKQSEKEFISLVNKAVSKGMTYAQIGEFLNDSLSAADAEIISDHPSLTKDFIRTCRQQE